MLIVPRPLTADAYAPFGRVVALPGAPSAASKPEIGVAAALKPEIGVAANQGTARKYEWLTDLENLRPHARLNVSVFRCDPRALPLQVRVLEKHPCSTQLFVPMNASRYLVLTAHGGDAPDLSTLAAFVADGTQAVSYGPGVWHHPMAALDRETQFACFVYEDRSPLDCVEWQWPAGAEQAFVEVEPI